jgi:hypothetical protein
MKPSFPLSPEERHLVKVGDLDALEQIARAGLDEFDVAGIYERIFEAFDNRTKTSPETVLDWGQRYLAWATSFTERDGFPFMSTDWAKRLFERALSSQRPDIAARMANAILCSYAPLEKERRWWEKQHFALTQKRVAE